MTAWTIAYDPRRTTPSCYRIRVMNLNLASDYAVQMSHEPPVLADNGAAQTWQASHVWCVRDPVVSHRGVEDFLAKVFLSNPFSSHHVSEPPGEQRADLPTWLLGLDVAEVDVRYLDALVASALGDLQMADDADDEVDATVRLLRSIEPGTRGWKLAETFEPRHPVGATRMALFVSSACYVYLEIHNES